MTSTSTPSISTPILTAAQIMADLDSLNNCDPTSARALLSASSTLSPQFIRRRSQASLLPPAKKFDKLGRRIVTPTLSRLNSSSPSIPGSEDGSRSQSPSRNKGSGDRFYGGDEDMRRARELVELVEKRESFGRMGTVGLEKSKVRVDEIVQRYAEKNAEAKARTTWELRYEDQSFN